MFSSPQPACDQAAHMCKRTPIAALPDVSSSQSLVPPKPPFSLPAPHFLLYNSSSSEKTGLKKNKQGKKKKDHQEYVKIYQSILDGKMINFKVCILSIPPNL